MEQMMKHSFFWMFPIKIAVVSFVLPISLVALILCLLFFYGIADWHLNTCSTLMVCVLNSFSRIWDIVILKILFLLWVVYFALLMWTGRDVWKDEFNSR